MRTGVTRNTLFALGATLAVLFGARPAAADFIIPPRQGMPPPPFTWNLGQMNSVYAHYDNFRNCQGTYPGPFTGADRGSFFADLWDPMLIELSGQAFLTGGGNIYSPDVATSFLGLVPNYNHSATGNWTTTVFLQFKTLGSQLNYASVFLLYFDGQEYRIATFADLIHFDVLRYEEVPGLGHDVETIFGFEVPYNPEYFIVYFQAAESSMSLDQFRVDTFTRPRP